MDKLFFTAFAERYPHACFVFDLQANKLLYVNTAFRTLFSSNTETVSLSSLLSLIHIEDREYLEGKLQDLLAGGPLADVDFRMETAGTGLHWLRLNANLSKESSTDMIAGTIADITASRQSMDTYHKYSNKKNSILNLLAHDLRGPLGIAQMANSVLETSIEDLELRRFTDTIARSIKHAIGLITDLLSREFLETTEVILNKRRVDIAAKMKDAVEEYKRSEMLTKKNFLFSSSDHSIFLEIDEPKFMQVINNLMSNALKFTKEGDTIEVQVDEREESVLFCISDTGIGIPQQFHASLFDKFTDASRKGLQGETSTGLGMHIVKMIVEWHNGQIWFKSEENKGTSFYFEIPKGHK